jgi:hypothetical protein
VKSLLELLVTVPPPPPPPLADGDVLGAYVAAVALRAAEPELAAPEEPLEVSWLGAPPPGLNSASAALIERCAALGDRVDRDDGSWLIARAAVAVVELLPAVTLATWSAIGRATTPRWVP